MPRIERLAAEDGAELIEFALVLPLLLMILLGIIEFGMLFQRYYVVSNAAREGARVSVLPGYSDADVQTRVTQFLTAGGLTEPAVTTVDPPQAIDVGGQCISVRRVNVEYPYQFTAVGALAAFFDGVGFDRAGVRASASMRSEIVAGVCS